MSLVISHSSAPPPSDSFQNKFRAPSLLEVNVSRFPSGVQMGELLSASNVSGVTVSPSIS